MTEHGLLATVTTEGGGVDVGNHNLVGNVP